MEARRALLVLDLQKEFLDPSTGRCLLANNQPVSATIPNSRTPEFITNIAALLPHFRQPASDIIWVRSESKSRRDFTDPRVEETVFVVNSDDESSASESEKETSSEEKGKPASLQRARITRTPSVKSGKLAQRNGGGLSRPPLLTDAYLSIDTKFPPVAPGSIASDWDDSVANLISLPPDQVLVKSWYSAFKDTCLLESLRGRVVTQLYLVGLMTNVSVLATAADAARHGLDVYVLSDCLGYRSPRAHEQALEIMVEDYAVNLETSAALLKKKPKKSRSSPQIDCRGSGLGSLDMSKEELTKIMESLQLGPSSSTDTKGQDVKERRDSSSPTKSKSTPSGSPVKGPRRTPTSPKPENSESAHAGSSSKETQEEGTSPMKEALPYRRTSQRSRPKERVHRKPVARSRPEKVKESSKAGEDGKYAEGDTHLISSILPPELAEVAFDRVKAEVQWRSMFHRGGEVPRLVAVEGEIDEDGSIPIYRHPADESPPLLAWSPTVLQIRKTVEEKLAHNVNHVLIQHYRHGNDYISEHSDKTLDIAKGSKIANLSLGAQRTMVLRKKEIDKAEAESKPQDTDSKQQDQTSKPPREAQKIPLPHNSLFVLGLDSNDAWLHGIRQDRRRREEKSTEELSHDGERISLTFRKIATFLDEKEETIWGQGATGKTKDQACPVFNGVEQESEKLLLAFGDENRRPGFDWEKEYGAGFDVLHLTRPLPKLFTTEEDELECQRSKICLYEKGIAFAEEKVSSDQASSMLLSPRKRSPIFIDMDRHRTILYGSLSILQYLEMYYPPSDERPDVWLLPDLRNQRSAYGMTLSRLQDTDRFLSVLSAGDNEAIQAELDVWDTVLKRANEFVAGPEFSLADIALYPIIKACSHVEKLGNFKQRWPALETWMQLMGARESVRNAYGILEAVVATEEDR